MSRHGLVTIFIRCSATEGYFADDLTPEIDAELRANGPIPCEGNGICRFCDACRFCDTFEIDGDEHKDDE